MSALSKKATVLMRKIAKERRQLLARLAEAARGLPDYFDPSKQRAYRYFDTGRVYFFPAFRFLRPEDNAVFYCVVDFEASIIESIKEGYDRAEKLDSLETLELFAHVLAAEKTKMTG